MANKNLFTSIVGTLLPKANTVNLAGGAAYQFSSKHALAQYAATGCLNSTYYASDEQQLDMVLKLCERVEAEFIARTALYCRQTGFMKDMPALLCAVLSVKSPGLMAEIFDRVIDNAKMLRNFVQIMRSGVVGRKSLGTLPKRLIVQWLEKRTAEQIFVSSTGSNPSMADIIRMVHPRPETKEKEALYGYFIGSQYTQDALPEIVKQYEQFKGKAKTQKISVPDVPFQFLTALELSTSDWMAIAKNVSWQTLRMNLNTFQRHGVFNNKDMVKFVADKLKNPDLIGKARVFPYQLMTAYMNRSSEIPHRVGEALQDAMEIALKNVPEIQGKVYVFPDISSSMHSPATGFRKGASSKVRCVDIAALVTSAIYRKNPETRIMPFSTTVVDIRLNPRDSVMSNAQKLSSMPGGGTNCSAPLIQLNQHKAMADMIIYVSDNES